MMIEDCIHTQIELISTDNCYVHRIVQTRQGDTVILYSPTGGFDIHARIVFATGIATKRHLNDLNMYITPVDGRRAWNLQYIRILGEKINQGYGSLMMEQLLTRAVEENIRSIVGRMQAAEHKEHLERLRHFYTKFGFTIDEQNQIHWANKNF
ncbi:GNAT family N-acetyltransferase [Paenibacillus lignilyticus]|uniref:GNAT family N-acetyltransferase n=1 Tax=Paenibacillus lignilyticus TaxID=1172615 RepID=A0ABS5C5D9_9BACL|nr:GNAT family N-acetyltransferase [Paenibacillus lignilyticus]MBP3961214.1 GNAT family N-acetyltransferase [Paenibacillus lignilyticus]